MEKEANKNHDEERLKNLPLQTEDLAFKPEEMVVCGVCQRPNPPNRFKCLYCGAELEIDELQAKNIKPDLRKLEIWEKGFNLIYHPVSKDLQSADLAEIAKLLNLEGETIKKICELRTPLPIARVESEREAEVIQGKLNEFGVKTSVLSDEKLSAKNPPRRLRGLEFSDDNLSLIFFNTDEIAEIASKDLVLIVTGAIFERRTESVERRKKGESKVLSATETSSDEMLIDIYTHHNFEGFRIFAKGFDFSCLGTEKEILARDNLKKLTEKLKSVAPNARLVENYLAVRESLGSIWALDEMNDSKGLTRQGFGKFNLENTTTVTNWTQFNKFSRLQFHNL